MFISKTNSKPYDQFRLNDDGSISISLTTNRYDENDRDLLRNGLPRMFQTSFDEKTKTLSGVHGAVKLRFTRIDYGGRMGVRVDRNTAGLVCLLPNTKKAAETSLQSTLFNRRRAGHRVNLPIDEMPILFITDANSSLMDTEPNLEVAEAFEALPRFGETEDKPADVVIAFDQVLTMVTEKMAQKELATVPWSVIQVPSFSRADGAQELKQGLEWLVDHMPAYIADKLPKKLGGH